MSFARGDAGPEVSVIIPCYNAVGSLRLAVGSMLAQTFSDWECIVVDDGSTDGTWELLQTIRDSRFRLHRLPENRGRGWARAEALALATGRYLGMVDADDWVYPQKLAVQVAHLESSPNLGFVSNAAAICDAEGAIIGRQGPSRDRTLAPTRRLEHARLIHASTLFRTDVVREFGYDRSLRFCEDKDLLVQVTRAYAGRLLAEPLYVYAQPGSMSFEKMAASYGAHLRIWSKHLKREPVRSVMLSAEAVAKREIYRAAYACGLGDRMVERRWSAPTAAEVDDYERALAVVLEQAKSLDSALAPR